MKKLNRLKELKPHLSTAELVEWMLNRCLKQIDPLQKPCQKKEVPKKLPPQGHPGGSSKKIKPLRTHLSRATKHQVWKRAGGQCEYKNHGLGTKCQAHSYLEVDHIQPLVLGGSDEVSNLRLLCKNHHQLLTDETFK